MSFQESKKNVIAHNCGQWTWCRERPFGHHQVCVKHQLLIKTLKVYL